jgi:hypothetical protein
MDAGNEKIPEESSQKTVAKRITIGHSEQLQTNQDDA